MNKSRGFSLIEILIATAILSIVLLGVYSGVSTSIRAMSRGAFKTRAMVISQSKLNEFILDSMRGADIQRQPVENYPNYYFSRTTKRYEHPMTGSLPAQRTEITVTWTENKRERKYTLSYIFTESQ